MKADSVEDSSYAKSVTLLVASADPVGDPTLLWRAVAELGIALDSAAPAESADLLHIGARVVFRPNDRGAGVH